MSHTQTSKCDCCGKEVTYGATIEGDQVLDKSTGGKPAWYNVQLAAGNREVTSFYDACSLQCATSLFESSFKTLREKLESGDKEHAGYSLVVQRTLLPKPHRPL